MVDRDLDKKETIKERIFIFKIHQKYQKGRWCRIEIGEYDSLGLFDYIIRESFDLDLDDHLSEFYSGSGRRKEYFGEIAPDGTGTGRDIKINTLDLSEGDKIGHIYDFGDNYEHSVVLEGITELDPKVDYPRCTAITKKKKRYCIECKEKNKKKSEAQWVCIDCSEKRRKHVLLCDECLEENHEEHYYEEYK